MFNLEDMNVMLRNAPGIDHENNSILREMETYGGLHEKTNTIGEDVQKFIDSTSYRLN